MSAKGMEYRYSCSSGKPKILNCEIYLKKHKSILHLFVKYLINIIKASQALQKSL